MKNILITGGCGFIGSNFIRYAHDHHSDWNIINLDKLTYAGNIQNVASVSESTRYHFIQGDISDVGLVEKIMQEYSIAGIFHFAAETHVDRSILDAASFIDSNVKGTLVLLDAARKYDVARFIYISTDEIYGDLGAEGRFTEESPLQPHSPYAASKAAADMLVQSYIHTFDFPAVITRSSNNYGPYQYPEKLIPLMILNALHDEKLPVYGDGSNVRDWLFVEDHCRALDVLFEKGKTGEAYNIAGGNELKNIDVVKRILHALGKPENLIQYVIDRPGHDRRYALDTAKLRRETGWTPARPFEDGLTGTIHWYKNNQKWWRALMTRDYERYKEIMYGVTNVYSSQTKTDGE